MGKTISITLPNPLVDKIQKEADKQEVSRSRFINNILIKWQEEFDKNQTTNIKE